MRLLHVSFFKLSPLSIQIDMFRLKFFILLGCISSIHSLRWGNARNGYEYHMTNSRSKSDTSTWYDARDSCMAEGGDLITLVDAAEEYHIGRISSVYYGNLWIGLNRLEDKVTWKWADGKTTTLNRWRSNEPRVNELCAYRNSKSSYYWYSENCGERKGFLCKRVQGQTNPKTTIPPTTVGGYCPLGWLDPGTDRCFKIFKPDDTLTWASARVKCKLLTYNGADLACANVQSEVSALQVMAATQSSVTEMWIGVFRTYYRNSWKWSDNSPVTVTNWNNKYRSTDDGCGFTSSALKPAGSWDDDLYCNRQKNAYICQIMKDPKNFISTPPTTAPNSCRSGYIPFQDNCYRVFTDTKSFDSSKMACAGDKAVLADIHSSGENAVLQFMVSKAKIERTWIGMQFNKDKRIYQWISNWYVNYVNWAPNQPRREDKTTGGCVSFDSEDSEWSDLDCSTELQYICKTTTQAPVTEPPEQEGRCPSLEWLSSGGYCYYTCWRGCTDKWIDQQADCAKQFKGAQMASIHDAVTNDKIFKKLKAEYSSGNAWLGLFQSAIDSRWRWIDNSQLEYVNWADNEPPSDPSSINKCAWMSLADASAGQWKTGRCEVDRKGMMCKLPKIQNPATPSPVNGSCPNSMWAQFGDKCYLFKPDELTEWFNAQGHCINEGGSESTMAIINGWAENDFVHHGMVANTHFPGDRNFWIGMAARAYKEPYQWLDGRNVSDGFAHWGPHQPSTSSSRLCGEMNKNTANWQNQMCSYYNGYVCQIAVVPYKENTPRPPPDGPNAGKVVGIVFGVLFAVLLISIVGVLIFRHVTGNPMINFSRFTNPTAPSTKAGFDPHASPGEYA